MKHQYEDRKDGLAECRVCKGGESTLSTECCGYEMTETMQKGVQAGTLDYFDRGWHEGTTEGAGKNRFYATWFEHLSHAMVISGGGRPIAIIRCEDEEDARELVGIKGCAMRDLYSQLSGNLGWSLWWLDNCAGPTVAPLYAACKKVFEEESVVNDAEVNNRMELLSRRVKAASELLEYCRGVGGRGAELGEEVLPDAIMGLSTAAMQLTSQMIQVGVVRDMWRQCFEAALN